MSGLRKLLKIELNERARQLDLFPDDNTLDALVDDRLEMIAKTFAGFLSKADIEEAIWKDEEEQ